MRRAALAAFVLCGIAACAHAQLVPVATCHAALPCSIPYGLRPADSLQNNPNGSVSNTAIGMHTGLENGLHPKVITRPVSEDPSEYAARVFVRKNPPLKKPAPALTPSAPTTEKSPAP